MEEAMWGFVQVIIEQLIAVLLPVLLAAVIGWVTYAIKQQRAKLGEQKWLAIENAVRFAVLAAEQTGLGEKLQMAGGEKKELALRYADELLRERGIELDVYRLDALIEAKVAEELNWRKIENHVQGK